MNTNPTNKLLLLASRAAFKTVRRVILLAGLGLCLPATPGTAQTLYWDGGTVNISTNGDGLSQGAVGVWDTATVNWDRGAGQTHIAWNNSQNYDAWFGATGIPATAGAGLVTLGANVTADTLMVVTTNYVFGDNGSGNTLTVNTVTNPANTTISNNIVNAGTFVKDGGGTLTLLGNSGGLTGTVVVTNGTLAFGSTTAGAPTGPQSVTSVSVATNATFKKLVNATGTTPSEVISGGGSFYLNANSYTSSVILQNANTYTGSTTINAVTAVITSINDSSANPLGTGTNVFLCTGASTSDLQYDGSGDTTSRTLTLGGTSGTCALISSIYGPLLWNGPAVPAANAGAMRTLTLSGTSTLLNVFGGAITDGPTTNMAVAKGNTGSWWLTGSNSYSGGTVLNAGTLYITNDDALGVSTGAVTFINASGSALMGALRSASNNVTLGSARTINMGYTSPGGFGVSDNFNLVVASYLTGTGSVQVANSAAYAGVTRFSNNTNSYTGDFSVQAGTAEFTSVANQGNPSSLGKGATATGGAIKLSTVNSYSLLRYVGNNNSATTRPLNWQNAQNLTLDVTNTGTIAYLSTTAIKSGSSSANLNLQGSNTGTNTLAQPINDSGGVTSLTKNGNGQWVLAGANAYSGGTTIYNGQLTVSSDGNLGSVPGSATPNSLTINGGALSASASFTLNALRGIALGPTGTNSLGANATGNGTIDVASGATLTYGGIMADNTSTNSGGLIKTSAGTLTLSGANTYSGNTTISAGTLALTGSGAVGASNLLISAGATFDVSGLSGAYALAAGQTLVATNGATATVKGSLNVAAAGVVLTNLVHLPTLAVVGGTLTLGGGTTFAVNLNNGGTALGAGSYKLISKGAGGAVGGTAPAAVAVGGDGLVGGATAALNITGGELFLVVSGGTLYPPVIGGLSQIGGKMVLSFSGTNGQTWKVLTSTNLTTPLTNWTSVANGTFAGAAVNYTNATTTEPKRFYVITSP